MQLRRDATSTGVFPYRTRVRANARNVRLRVTYERGLEVTVPRGFNTARIPALLQRQSAWILDALERVAARQQLRAARDPWRPPAQIVLPAIAARWSVCNSATAAARVTLIELDAQNLLLRGAVEDEAACRHALSRWVMQTAHAHLVPRLHAASLALGLTYQRVMIRRQRTRWASCSSRGTICLSANLLFLQPALVDYVLTHELCHLREMNHSRRFWQLVAQHYPDYRSADAQLRRMTGLVPRWAMSHA